MLVFTGSVFSRRAYRVVFAALTLGTVSCVGSSTVAPTFMPAGQNDGVLVGAGDIADCGPGATATALLLDQIDGVVFTAGDDAYPSGSAGDFRRCYEPTWGRHKARTRPAPGNHEYETAGAFPYFDYFGANAGTPGLGYYSFDVGEWLVLSLNSNVDAGPNSPEMAWLRQTLEERLAHCIAAIWHHPLASSGPNGNSPRMRGVWALLQEFGAEFVISGHDHLYERFAPLGPQGEPSSLGIRSFIVGTGGAPLYQPQTLHRGSEVRASVWGVLKLTLRPSSYEWTFVSVPGTGALVDQGSAPCD